MYTLIGSYKSRALRVLWMLEELGVEYEHIVAPPHSPEVLKHNPAGKVPAFVVDGEVITDSVAIMTYLGDVHGQFTAPAGTIERAQQDAMTLTIIDDFDALLWTAAKHSFVLPEEQRNPTIKENLKWEFARNAERLGARFTDNEFLMGDQLTIPDFLLVHCMGWARVARFDVARDSAVMDYVRRVIARPAYQRATSTTA